MTMNYKVVKSFYCGNPNSCMGVGQIVWQDEDFSKRAIYGNINQAYRRAENYPNKSKKCECKVEVQETTNGI